MSLVKDAIRDTSWFSEKETSVVVSGQDRVIISTLRVRAVVFPRVNASRIAK